jgi:hypothetical protein
MSSISDSVGARAGAFHGDDAGQARVARWTYLSLGLGTAAFFYLHLFRFPLTPIWHDGDAAIFLEHADRMLRGAVLYRDIFQFNLPGMEWLYYIVFRLLGTRLWIPNAMLLCVGTAVTLLVYALARLVLLGAAALLPALAFLVVCQRSSLDGGHHWYSTLLVLIAANMIARMRKPAWIAVAGAVLGASTVVTSSRGVFAAAGVAVYLLWSCGGVRAAARPIAALLATFCAVVGATLWFLETQVGAKVLYDSLVVFPLRYYGKGDANGPAVFFDEWHSLLPLSAHSLLSVALWFAINLATPVLLIAFALRLVRRKRSDTRAAQALVLFVCVGISMLISVASAPAAPRLNCAAAFAYVLGAVWVDEYGGRRVVLGLVWAICIAAIAEMASNALRPVHAVDGARGEVVVYRSDRYEYLSWLARHAQPGDGYFGFAPANWLLGLRDPAPVQWVEADAYTRPEQLNGVIAALDRERTRFVDPLDPPEDGKAGTSSGDSLAPLRAYLSQHYHVAQRFSDGGYILERNATDGVSR